jgi:hypothetical protein
MVERVGVRLDTVGGEATEVALAHTEAGPYLRAVAGTEARSAIPS